MPRIPLNNVVLALLFFTAFSVGETAVAREDLNILLNGDYAFSQTRVCTQFGTTATSISFGTIKFSGDGTGSFEETGGPNESTGGGIFSYAVNPNRSFTTEFEIINFTFPQGGPFISGTVTGVVSGGQIAEGQKVLVFGSLNRNTEIVSLFNSQGTPLTFPRTCARSGSAVKIQ